MPIKFTRTVFRSGDSFRITIPMPIIDGLEIKEKDVLEIWLTDHEIVMKKATNEKKA
jgi:bifunctional DNA-binding transcriptional regulator/antitoxin component of YhaV-PrlF toxin-antitoxin module